MSKPFKEEHPLGKSNVQRRSCRPKHERDTFYSLNCHQTLWNVPGWIIQRFAYQSIPVTISKYTQTILGSLEFSEARCWHLWHQEEDVMVMLKIELIPKSFPSSNHLRTFWYPFYDVLFFAVVFQVLGFRFFVWLPLAKISFPSFSFFSLENLILYRKT